MPVVVSFGMGLDFFSYLGGFSITREMIDAQALPFSLFSSALALGLAPNIERGEGCFIETSSIHQRTQAR
jgi:hypothetical protein